MQDTQQAGDASEFTDRQREVLTCVLDLMVEAGDRFSIAAVARRARCSKESIYKWFGDREGVLTATVQWQAAKVRAPELPRAGLTRELYVEALEQFAENWLTVIASDVSIALNRLAITHAATGAGSLGRIVLDNGPYAMARRLQPIFELGRKAGFLDYGEASQPFRSFFGLVVADLQIRLLLGDADSPDKGEIGVLAGQAVTQFLALYGTPLPPQES